MHTVIEPACLSPICCESLNGIRSNRKHFTTNGLSDSLDMVSIRTADNAVAGDSDIASQACESDLTGKLCIGAIEKRVRNLEKRKIKLDGYKQKFDDGEKLAKEQMEALEKYEVVSSNLDFAKEMHKQIQSIVAEVEDVRMENHYNGSSNSKVKSFEVEEIVMLQSLLGIMNSKQSRLLKSSNILKSEEVASLLEFGNLIFSSGDLSFGNIRSVASHLCNYVNKEDVEVAGTTYSKIFELVHKIVNESQLLSQPKSNSQTIEGENSFGEIITIENNKGLDTEDSSDDRGYGSAIEPKASCNKSLQDILKDMEGEFTFLQESEIYKDIPKPQLKDEEPEESSLTTVDGPVAAPVCMVDADDTFAVSAHPMSNAVYLPKYVTIPFSNAIYAPSNTLPLTHHYTMPAFTSYDYNLQNQLPFQTVFHHAIINGTTYFHQPGTVYTTQAVTDPYNVAQIEEYADPTEIGTSAEVFYPSQYDLNIQQPAYQAHSEEQESEFETPNEILPELSPMVTSPQILQPSEEVPTNNTSPQPTHKTWQYNNRGRGGRGNYRGQRNFQNQSRYHKSRLDNDQMGSYRGHSRPQRFHNGNSFHQD